MKGHLTPVFLLAIDQKLVKQEENPLLYVSGRNLQQHALHEHLRARVRDVGALQITGQTERHRHSQSREYLKFYSHGFLNV